MPEQTPWGAALGKDFFTIAPRRTALIIIDMQNAFVAEGAVWESSYARMMIPRLERIIEFARDQGMPVIWTQSEQSPPCGGILLSKFPVLWEKRVTWRGEPGGRRSSSAQSRSRRSSTACQHLPDWASITCWCRSTGRSCRAETDRQPRSWIRSSRAGWPSRMTMPMTMVISTSVNARLAVMAPTPRCCPR